MVPHKLRILTAADVRAGLPMIEAIEAMKRAFQSLSEGKSVAPARAHIRSEVPPGDALFMPSHMPEAGRMGIKVVTLYPNNPMMGLPMLQAVMLVMDASTGSVTALTDGTMLTALRTGAASGAATDILSRRDACTVAIFGAGLQARTQLEAVSTVRKLREARVFDSVAANASAYADEMTARLGMPVRAAKSAEEALEGADIVCTATTSRTPVFEDIDIADGTHINAVGSYKPDTREIPGPTVARARVVIDHLTDALVEAGDLLIPLHEKSFHAGHISVELGDVIGGRKRGRRSSKEVTLFKSVGVAIQDLAAADQLLKNAERLGLGTEVYL